MAAPTQSANTEKPSNPGTIQKIWVYVVNTLFPPKKKPAKKSAPPANKPPKKDNATPKESPKPEDTEKKDPKKPEANKAQAPKKPEEPSPKTPDKNARNWQVIVVAWYKSSVVPNAKKIAPWLKKQAKDLWEAIKKAREDFKKSREEKRKKAEEELKNPSPERLKWISKDPYGSFGYDGFNLHKGVKKEPVPQNADPLDPEKHFRNRTDVRTEPPIVVKKKKTAATTIAKIGGVPSSRISRIAMSFTNLAEHDHTIKNMIQNGSISFLAHTLPGAHEVLPSFVRSGKLFPINFDFNPEDLNANGKRVLFLLNANLLQYLVSNCIAYKSTKIGLRKALWDDTNMRNLCVVLAGAHLFKKDAIGQNGLNKLSRKFKIAAIGLLVTIALKVVLDQFLESRNIIFEVKQALATKSDALGVKEGHLPEEMKGRRYIIFNSVTSKLVSFIITCLGGAYHSISAWLTAESPAASLAFTATHGVLFAIKALFSIQNTYLLESDLQYLSPKLKDRVTQHIISHKILATMMYSITLATVSQTALKTPYIIQQLRSKRPMTFRIATLETLRKNLPEHIRKQIDIDAAKHTEYSQHSNNYPLFRDLCIKLVLLNMQQSTDANYAETQAIVADLLANKRPKLFARLQRFDGSQYLYWDSKFRYESDAAFEARKARYQTDLNNARSPLFTTEFIDPTDKTATQNMMDLLAKDILDNNVAFAE